LNEFKQTADSARVSKEDLDLTRSTYEGQLAAMTEALLGKTEKLNSKEQEVASIKSQKVACIKCKQGYTVEQLLTRGARSAN